MRATSKASSRRTGPSTTPCSRCSRVTPNAARSSSGRYTRPRRRSSPTSRMKFDELEGDAEVGGVRLGDLARDERLEHRHHLQADDRRRAVHVGHQVGVRRVLGDRQVHPHRGQEVLDVLQRDVPPPHGVDDRPADLVLAARRPRRRRGTGRPSRPASRPSRASVSVLAEVVDDLVGVAREAVQRVHVRPLPGRQQQRGQVVGPPVLGVEPPAGLVRRRAAPGR